MVPSLIIATVVFVAFLGALAAIGFAAYRFSARREGSGLGAAGGCALAAVLLGVAFMALIGFVIFGVVLVSRDGGPFHDQHHSFSFDEDDIEAQDELPSMPEEIAHPPALPPPADKRGDVREY